jgi:hypothetical protein
MRSIDRPPANPKLAWHTNGLNACNPTSLASGAGWRRFDRKSTHPAPAPGPAVEHARRTHHARSILLQTHTHTIMTTTSTTMLALLLLACVGMVHATWVLHGHEDVEVRRRRGVLFSFHFNSFDWWILTCPIERLLPSLLLLTTHRSLDTYQPAHRPNDCYYLVYHPLISSNPHATCSSSFVQVEWHRFRRHFRRAYHDEAEEQYRLMVFKVCLYVYECVQRTTTHGTTHDVFMA